MQMKYKTECEFETQVPKKRLAPKSQQTIISQKEKWSELEYPPQLTDKHTVAIPFSNKQTTHTLGKTAPIITDAELYQALPSLPISG